MCREAEKRFHFFLSVRWIASRGGGRLCIPLMHTMLDFNLARNIVGGRVYAAGKVTPIDPMPMGAQ
jgi:hypothetical protein